MANRELKENNEFNNFGKNVIISWLDMQFP